MTSPTPHVAFVVPGEPVPKGRPHASIRRRGKKLAIHMRTPEKTVDYEARVRIIAQAHKPSGWPMYCHYAVHVCVYRADASGGDFDNYLKIVDGLNPRRAKGKRPAVLGVLWSDDCRVRYADVEIFDHADQPRLEIRVSALTAPCKNKGCGHKCTYHLDAAGRCEDCAARPR